MVSLNINLSSTNTLTSDYLPSPERCVLGLAYLSVTVLRALARAVPGEARVRCPARRGCALRSCDLQVGGPQVRRHMVAASQRWRGALVPDLTLERPQSCDPQSPLVIRNFFPRCPLHKGKEISLLPTILCVISSTVPGKYPLY